MEQEPGTRLDPETGELIEEQLTPEEDDFFTSGDTQPEVVEIVDGDIITPNQEEERRPGRKSRLKTDKHMWKNMKAALEAGASDKKACQHALLSRKTFYEWMRTGEADFEEDRVSLERQWYEMVNKAKSAPYLAAVATVRKNLPNDPRLALEFLKARYPDEFGKQQLEVKQEENSTEQINARDASIIKGQLTALNSFLERARERALSAPDEGAELGLDSEADSPGAD